MEVDSLTVLAVRVQGMQPFLYQSTATATLHVFFK